MSSGLHPSPVVEKLDIRKYLLVLNRRKWWGIIPFFLLAAVFTVICLAVPYKYMSSCVIKASKSEVAEIYAGESGAKIRSQTIVSEEMLRFDRVMNALADTDVMRDLERKASGDTAERGRLEEKLHADISRNTAITPMGGILIHVSYLGDSPQHAFTILQKLVTHFVENALEKERNDARRARDMALTELARAKDELEGLENRLTAFREQHPVLFDITEGARRGSLKDVDDEIEKLDRSINAIRRKLERYGEQLENTPKQTVKSVKTKTSPEIAVYRQRLAELRAQLGTALKTFTPLHPTVKSLRREIEATDELLAEAERQEPEDEVELEANKVRDQLEEKKLELEAELDSQTESRRNLQLQKTKLDEEVRALPGLQKELTRLTRERTSAGERYDKAVGNFKRIDAEFAIKMEGLVSFSIVSPARLPHARDIRHIVRLAIMGLFVSLAIAVAAVAGTEFLDQSFSDVDSARDALRLPSLGVIPFIETPGDRRTRRVKTVIVIATLLIIIAALVVSVLFVPLVRQAVGKLWNVIRDACKDLV